MFPSPKNLNNLSKEVIRSFLNSFDTVLTDCDGVLWLENELIEGSQHVINKFVEQEKKLFYVTNNSSKVREGYVEKCRKLGFTANEDNIISMAYLAADYLKSINFDKKVYVCGSEAMVKELSRMGIRYTDFGPDVLNTTLENYVQTKLFLDPEVGAVLQGFDQHFSYPKIMKAATYLRDPKVLFLGTCPDESFRFNSELVLPGTGGLVRCLEAVTGRKAFILGKPNQFVKEAILRKHKLEPERTLMIGDRCNTDIAFGNKCGFQTLLVLTGVSSLSDVERFAASKDPKVSQQIPKFYVNRLGDLLPYM